MIMIRFAVSFRAKRLLASGCGLRLPSFAFFFFPTAAELHVTEGIVSAANGSGM